MAKDPLITRQSYRKYQKKKREKALEEAKQEAGQGAKKSRPKAAAASKKPKQKARPASQASQRPRTKSKPAKSSDRGRTWHWRQGQEAKQLADQADQKPDPRPIDEYLNWGIGLSLLGIIIVTLIAFFV
ncbi:hypothetical protein QP860_03650 [Aerococcus sp. UMB1112A]|uniref:hypothetical protein n=1 Tax=Aerococcus sp. UMB1112A TaxID=3050609 RepID=UPI00254E797B|nr:hypothetical protein [Aerococcus sp. UMB1112A]MDK8502144.1 hypothetical protein [Aerococcus sp. UMB1112A]